MSTIPSPGPSHSAAQQSVSAPPARRPRPSHPVGITAGAEDAKYQNKYKDLKRKVKEIEGDNDRIKFKLLDARRSIQRLTLERAILYDRIAATAPQPDAQVPAAPGPGLTRSFSGSQQNNRMDTDPPPGDYLRPPRAPPAQDPSPRPQVQQPLDSAALPSPHMSSLQSPTRNNAAHDNHRHLPPLQHLPPVAQYDPPVQRTHSHAASPPLHHASSSLERARSQPTRLQQPYPQQYPEHLPPVQRVLHSPPPHSSDRDRQRNEYPQPTNDPHAQHSRHSSQVSPHLRSIDTRTSATRLHAHQRLGPGSYINARDELPRPYEMDRERERERDIREREWEREHRPRESGRGMEYNPDIHSPHTTHRRPIPPPFVPSDYPEPASHSHQQHQHQNLPPPPPPPPSGQQQQQRLRDQRDQEQTYYHEGGNPYPSLQPHISRSDTPGSNSNSNNSGISADGPSRPDSRTQFYEQQQQQQDRNMPQSFRLRPVGNSEDIGHESTRDSSNTSNVNVNSNAPPLSSSTGPGPIVPPPIPTIVTTPSSGNSNGPGSGGHNGTGSNNGGGVNSNSNSNNNNNSSNNFVTPTLPPPPSVGSSNLGDQHHHHQLQTSTTRKRSRNDMEVDSDDDVGGDGTGPGGYKLQQGEDRERERDWENRVEREALREREGLRDREGLRERERERERDRERGSAKRYREHHHRRSVDDYESGGNGGGLQDRDRDRERERERDGMRD